MEQPWKTDKWFTSPWCYLPEVKKDEHFAPKVKIHDVTLRHGEQLVRPALGVVTSGATFLGVDDVI